MHRRTVAIYFLSAVLQKLIPYLNKRQRDLRRTFLRRKPLLPVPGELQIRHKHNHETVVATSFNVGDANVKRCCETS
jgi:hypothetical protein